MCGHRGGHKANLLSLRDATILCGEPKNNRELRFSPLFFIVDRPLDLIYPLLDNHSIVHLTLAHSHSSRAHNKVYRNAGEIVACMDWAPTGYQHGVLTIANRQSPMTRFVMHGSTVKYVLTLDFLGYIRPFRSLPPHEIYFR